MARRGRRGTACRRDLNTRYANKTDRTHVATDRAGQCIDEVISGEGAYAVCLDGVSIGLRHSRLRAPDAQPKYRRTLFAIRGWAIALAERLNRRFQTAGSLPGI
jgi:hypothetical protein